MIKKILSKIKRFISSKANNNSIPTQNTWNGSANYWEKRYLTGGNSGKGSYDRLALFKAEIINQFVKDHNINIVIEWGSGDGNQLQYGNYKQYVGFDVSKKAIEICNQKYKNDKTKKFIYSGDDDFKSDIKGDLSMSLDVIYHLIEDEVYTKYMKQLFESSNKYVCIYSCNDEDNNNCAHIKHRIFTNFINNNFPEWKLIKLIKNKYPYNPNDDNTSWSDFYFYQKA